MKNFALSVKNIFWLLHALIVADSSIIRNPRNTDAFQLTVLHLNDIHARIEQTNQFLGLCDEDLAGKS